MKKALVISGGGSKGAFAGGVAQYLMKKKNKKYDLFLGTSTGSLMVSHLALGMLDELKDLYTNVNQETIFSNNPFKIKKVAGEKVISINHLNTFWNFLNGRKTFGESKNLRSLIKRKVTKEMYDAIKEANKEGNSYLVEMKLRWYNRNVYGTHFGGSLYAMCDPFFVFAAYSYFGDEYILWDKSAKIEFKRPGKGTMRALFEIPISRLKEMKGEVDAEGKKTFTFTAEVKDLKDNIVAVVEKEIYIRKKDNTK